jgi:hypothetical protein
MQLREGIPFPRGRFLSACKGKFQFSYWVPYAPGDSFYVKMRNSATTDRVSSFSRKCFLLAVFSLIFLKFFYLSTGRGIWEKCNNKK